MAGTMGTGEVRTGNEKKKMFGGGFYPMIKISKGLKLTFLSSPSFPPSLDYSKPITKPDNEVALHSVLEINYQLQSINFRREYAFGRR